MSTFFLEEEGEYIIHLELKMTSRVPKLILYNSVSGVTKVHSLSESLLGRKTGTRFFVKCPCYVRIPGTITVNFSPSEDAFQIDKAAAEKVDHENYPLHRHLIQGGGGLHISFPTVQENSQIFGNFQITESRTMEPTAILQPTNEQLDRLKHTTDETTTRNNTGNCDMDLQKYRRILFTLISGCQEDLISLSDLFGETVNWTLFQDLTTKYLTKVNDMKKISSKLEILNDDKNAEGQNKITHKEIDQIAELSQKLNITFNGNFFKDPNNCLNLEIQIHDLLDVFTRWGSIIRHQM